MILSEKICELRKRAGLSQEEFGAEIGVSRQAVSKWETAQAMPDLNKVIAIAKYFSVPADLLLNDEYDLSSAVMPAAPAFAEGAGTVSLEEIQAYLGVRKTAARNLVAAVFLFFLSPLAGIFITVFNEKLYLAGLLLQIVALAAAAVILVLTFLRLSGSRHLFRGQKELAYGVRGAVTEQRKQFERTFLLCMITGVICMFLFVVPMMTVSAFTDTNNAAIAAAGCVMLAVFALGISCIVYAVFVDRGFRKVLKLK
ncbi:MAG: helix-turn-helix domain-containing protein [Solobacterium sp.]|nr:helix-turn-helix domain-containing protein [Solobacterium sp.]